VNLKKLPIASKSEIWTALIGLTLASVALSVGLAIVALWMTTSGNPDTLVPEGEIWAHMIFFSALIPAMVCPTVVYALLNTLRELHLARAELDAIAHRDPLTGLLNRRGFDEAAAALIDQEIARREQVSALLCDIDHFKRINDTYGHECGDIAIRHVATVIRSTLTTFAKVAIGRQGGEEFAVIATGRSVREIAQMAEALRANVAATPFGWEGEDIRLTISVGTSMSASTGASVQSLLSSADEALYEAKRRGRNRVVQAQFAVAA
jgi:diguanylate cyclase (GGDEF)-like protein